MNIPKITSIEKALYIFYNNPEIGGEEIRQLFGKSKATTHRLKKIAMEAMYEHNTKTNSRYKVNTSIAYKAWGIDITDLEARRKKLKELKLKIE